MELRDTLAGFTTIPSESESPTRDVTRGTESEEPGRIENFDANRIRIHPRVIVRICGEPVELIDLICDGQTAIAIQHYNNISGLVGQNKKSADEILGALYPVLPDKDARHALLQAKRAIFNDRTPDMAQLSPLLLYLDADKRQQLEAAVVHLFDLQAAEKEVEASYRAELLHGEDAVRLAATRPNFATALRMTNKALFQSLQRPVELLSPRDASKLSTALTTYLLRCTTKTSPKSSLTVIAVARWQPSEATKFSLSLADWQLAPRSQPRRSLVDRAILPLVADLGKLNGLAPIRFNGTGKVEGGICSWRCIARSELLDHETFGVIEQKKALRLSPGLEKAFSVLATLPPEGLPKDAVVAKLGAALPQKMHGATLRFLDNCMQQGLLQPAFVGSEQGDRVQWAHDVCGYLDPKLGDAIRLKLGCVEQALDLIAPGGGHESDLSQVETVFDEFVEAAGGTDWAAAARPIVHQDYFVTKPELHLGGRLPEMLKEDLDDLLRLIPLLRGFGWAQYWLVARFVQQFGDGGICTSPSDFLNDASHAIEDGVQGASIPGTSAGRLGQPPDHPMAQQLDAASTAFAQALATANAGKDGWTVSRQLLREHYRALPDAIKNSCRSYCINSQFLEQSGGMVINAVYPGNARMTSRFLSDGDVAEVRAYLSSLSRREPVVIPGVFGFNANCHPDLGLRELEIPPYPNDFQGSPRISLNDCTLVHRPETHDIVLCAPTGEIITPYFFGILNAIALPPTHRMLDWLNGSSNLLFNFSQGVGLEKPGAEIVAIQERPRLSLGSLVLSRRALLVPTTSLPGSQSDDLSFFRAMAAFCEAQGLGRRLYSRLFVSAPEEVRNQTRPPKWRKPMYLAIDNPMTVRIFQRALRLHAGTVEFSEALPDPHGTGFTVNGDRHVSEFSIEIGLAEA